MTAARVLLADDDPMNRRVGEIVLERVGCEVTLVTNGAEAVQSVAEGEYDVVFMDCQMPVLDGFDATRQIRGNQDGGHRVTIVALTASALSDERGKCLAAGMDDFLEKPISVEGVEAILAQYVNNTTPAAPPIAAPTVGQDVDRQRLGELRALSPTGGDEMYIRLLDTFEGGVRRYVLAIETALQRPDFDQLRKSGHGLKGSAASVGATAVRMLAVSVEEAALAHDAETVRMAIPRITAAAERFQSVARIY